MEDLKKGDFVKIKKEYLSDLKFIYAHKDYSDEIFILGTVLKHPTMESVSQIFNNDIFFTIPIEYLYNIEIEELSNSEKSSILKTMNFILNKND